MHPDGERVIAYLGEDRQLYFNSPGKTICKFQARILHHGETKYLFITEIPPKYDGGLVKAPPGYQLQGLS